MQALCAITAILQAGHTQSVTYHRGARPHILSPSIPDGVNAL